VLSLGCPVRGAALRDSNGRPLADHSDATGGPTANDDDTRPLPLPPQMLTTSGKRAPAASMIRAADRPVPAALVGDVLDATAAAVLRVAGVDDETGRAVLTALWESPLGA
jgi:hypothetical protein